MIYYDRPITQQCEFVCVCIVGKRQREMEKYFKLKKKNEPLKVVSCSDILESYISLFASF